MKLFDFLERVSYGSTIGICSYSSFNLNKCLVVDSDFDLISDNILKSEIEEFDFSPITKYGIDVMVYIDCAESDIIKEIRDYKNKLNEFIEKE